MDYNNFEKIMQSLKIERNDLVMLHTDLSNFSKGSLGNKCNLFNKYLTKYFKDTGTILVPAFSYSFCKNGYFDSIKTKSEVGIFDEYFRLQKNVIPSKTATSKLVLKPPRTTLEAPENSFFRGTTSLSCSV